MKVGPTFEVGSTCPWLAPVILRGVGATSGCPYLPPRHPAPGEAPGALPLADMGRAFGPFRMPVFASA